MFAEVMAPARQMTMRRATSPRRAPDLPFRFENLRRRIESPDVQPAQPQKRIRMRYPVQAAVIERQEERPMPVVVKGNDTPILRDVLIGAVAGLIAGMLLGKK